MGHARLRAALAVLLLAAPLAPAHAASPEAGPFTVTVKAGGIDERCLRLAAGEAIDYAFSAEHAVEFNIHYHRGREVFYPVRLAEVTAVATQRFVAPATDDYCLMWENRGASAVRIDGRITPAR